ncbi:inositol monophosphatase [Amycolatopsis rhizosphaerae]|uniref:Inositol monophosphatase n=1 Tax=Amycolatopsis rhizosphaerae TaxID=2053003 RepID=A0A558CAB2_9PSEU|nr:inositol monophosphatase [Amycolatopsis rhizosphaerae]TVT45736.1 inositol monophosphatase [Amycolatopsis rhizosphaerae]
MPDLLDSMTEAALRAGRLLLARPRPPRARTFDELRTVFTEVDDEAVAVIKPLLTALRPEAAWADEFGPGTGPGEQWVADAVDGAVQYLQGLPHWCVSLTLVRHGRPVASVLHSPVSGETYRAAEGAGATRNGVPIRPSDKIELAAALLATSHPPFAADDLGAVARAGAALSAVLPVAGAVRNLGPTSWQIADVASGRVDGFWQYGHDDGNLLGATLIAREAGAFVTDVAGAPWRPGAESVLVAPAQFHGPLREALAQAEVSPPQRCSTRATRQ